MKNNNLNPLTGVYQSFILAYMTYQTYPQANVVERVRRALNVTQRGLAERAGLSVLYVIRAEQCIPQSLGPDLARALSKLTGELYKERTSEHELEHQYSMDRQDALLFYKNQFLNHPGREHFIEVALGYSLDNYVAGVGDRRGSRLSHPLCLFRTKLMSLYEWPTSAIKFNQHFGLHASILSSIENRKDTIERNSATFHTLRDILGVSEVQLEMLMKACDSCL